MPKWPKPLRRPRLYLGGRLYNANAEKMFRSGRVGRNTCPLFRRKVTSPQNTSRENQNHPVGGR
jgi:hypothetical protein